MNSLLRCDWCDRDPLYRDYHDTEWGVPLYNDQKLFELLTLEGAQAGLSWLIVLRKRNAYKKAFMNFDATEVAKFTQNKITELMQNSSIIRNRLKIEATVTNAKAFLAVVEHFGSFAQYSWQFVNGMRIVNSWQNIQELPSTSKEAKAFSKDLKQRGFKFVGPTIMYAYMQSTGMVNDHLVSCFRYDQV